MEQSGPESAVEIALAEFNALRTEIISHITAQTTVIGLGITALGIIVGFVAKEGADDHLLLVVPPLSMFVILLHTAEHYRMRMLGDYIRTRLWPFLEERAGPIPSWEGRVARYRSSQGAFAKAIAFDSPAIILFLAASVAALGWVWDYEDNFWRAGWLMTVIALVTPVAVALRSDSGIRPGRSPAARWEDRDRT